MFATRCVVLILVLAGSWAWAADSAPADNREPGHVSFIHQGMLDPDAPAERRAALGVEIERLALERKDPRLLYITGSLYRLGREASPTSPYPRDLDKAREYLSRAALAGYRSAMGKLAFIELEAGNRFEANVWAQLLAYYSIDAASERGREPERGKGAPGVASLLALVQDGFPKADLPQLDERVGMMIRTYDKSIRAGSERLIEESLRSPLRDARASRCDIPEGQLQRTRTRRPGYFAGGAEYYVSFADDGSAKQIWLLDVWPDVRMERGLRTCASRLRVGAAEAIAGKGLLVLLPISLYDSRVKLRDPGN